MTLARDSQPSSVGLGVHPRGAIGAARAGVDATNLSDQPGIVRLALGETLPPSGHRHRGSGPQPGVLAFEALEPGPLVAAQPVLLSTVDAVLPHPITKGRVVDAELPGDLGDANILLSTEVSCLRGEVH
jgi:hypothetical protein